MRAFPILSPSPFSSHLFSASPFSDENGFASRRGLKFLRRWCAPECEFGVRSIECVSVCAFTGPCFRVVLGTVVVIILECLPILSGLDELPGMARGLIVRDLPPVSLLPSLVFLLRIRPPCWVPSFPRL